MEPTKEQIETALEWAKGFIAERKNHQEPYQKYSAWQAETLVAAYRSEHERAERLEKALKVYSYPKDYEPEFVDVGIGEGQRIPGSEPVLTDGGRAARAALADVREMLRARGEPKGAHP